MNETITPRLRTDVLLRPYRQFDGDDRYVVVVDDRQFVVSPAVAAVLEESRLRSTLASLTARASSRLGMTVSAELASRVLSEGVLSVCFHATETRASSSSPIRLRRTLISAQLVKPLLAMTHPLFTGRGATALITLLVFIELLVASRAAEAAPHFLTGTEIVCTATLAALGVIVHELGHLAACSRFGASHGGIGVGVYWCVPVVYSELNGAWMLPRLQRAIVDAGGLYLQCGYVIALGAAYLLSGSPLILEAIVWTHLLMLHTLNPVLKYDGYWLLADLSDIPNLHAAIRYIGERIWQALTHSGALPGIGAFMLLSMFTVMAASYFGYVCVVLGRNIGTGLGEALHRWAIQHTSSFGTWHAIGESALLALFFVMALSLSLLFARSLYRLGKDSSQ